MNTCSGKGILRGSLICLILSICCIIVLAGPVSELQAAGQDEFIAGYAAAILEREFHVSRPALGVHEGGITLDGRGIASGDLPHIKDQLSGIKGVVSVDIQGAGNEGEHSIAAAGSQKASAQDSVQGFSSSREGLFDALMADPRWPSFSGAYQYYIDDDELKKIGAASVGDIIPLYTPDQELPFGGHWQVGAEVAAFVIHDFDTSSWDQINADYLFGLTMSYRKDTLSGIFRVFHFSSHVGDEYLLHNDVDRENYSYEAVGLTLSREVRNWLRLYGGGEYRFSRSPKDLDPFAIQYGVELKCPRTYAAGTLRPLAALDMKHVQDTDWSGQVSLMGGVKIEDPRLINHNLRLMLGYYNGHSPNGQFYRKSIQYTSLGLYYNY